MITFLLILLLIVSAGATVFAMYKLMEEPSGWAFGVASAGGLVCLVCLVKLFGWAMLVFAALAVVTLYSYAEWRKSKDATAKKVLIACTVLLLVLAGFRIAHSTHAANDRSGISRMKAENKSTDACWNALGEYLSRRFPDSGVLVLEYSWMAKSAQEGVIEDGLKKGADGKLKCVICEPVTGALTWDAYKTILNSHADCRVVVSVLGMPVGTAQPPAKTQGNVPTAKLIVFSEIGLHEDIAQRIAMGQISAAVIDCKNKAGVAELSKGGSTPALYGEVFHARYVLLDADNVGAVLKGQKPANHAR